MFLTKQIPNTVLCSELFYIEKSLIHNNFGVNGMIIKVMPKQWLPPNFVKEKFDKVLLYPNPTTGEFHIVEEGLKYLTVYSALGQEVYEADI